MRNPKRLVDMAVLLPIGAVVLFVPPYVGLADSAKTLFGLPTLHLYIFGVWGLGIVLTGLVARRLAALEEAGAEPEAGPPDGTGPDPDGPPPAPPRFDGDGI